MFYPTPKQMRTIEENSERNGISRHTLMQNAGRPLLGRSVYLRRR